MSIRLHSAEILIICSAVLFLFGGNSVSAWVFFCAGIINIGVLLGPPKEDIVDILDDDVSTSYHEENMNENEFDVPYHFVVSDDELN